MALANERREDGSTKLSKADEEDIRAINATIDRMRNFTPADPYVLTIPHDAETPRYQHGHKIRERQWLENTPFVYGEDERTQYQTFVYHEPGRSMYMLHNSRAPDAGTGVNGDAKEKAGTGANTPNVSAKKKISLDAYKKKQTGQTPEVTLGKELEKPVKKQAAKGPVERLKEDEEVLAAVEEDISMQPAKAVEPPEEKKDLKRKREEAPVETKVADKTPEQNDSPQKAEQPASKKLEASPPATTASSTVQPATASGTAATLPQTTEKARSYAKEAGKDAKLSARPSPSRQHSKDDQLPPRLSPLRPSPKDEVPPKKPPSLPLPLSPTIPVNVLAAVKTQEHSRSLSNTSEKSVPKTTIERTLTPPPTKTGKKKSPAPRNGFRANSSSPAVRSDAEDKIRIVTSVPKRAVPLDFESADDSEEIAVSKKSNDANSSARARKSEIAKANPDDSQSDKPKRLIVKLKFKKNMRERLRALLKTKPVPKKNVSSPSTSPQVSAARGRARTDSNAKGVAQRIVPPHVANGAPKKNGRQSSSSERKRTRTDLSDVDDSDTPPAKRKRALTETSNPTVKEPKTPAQTDVPSPASAQRSSSQLSPSNLRRDVLGTTMKRERSTDSATYTPNAGSPSVTGAFQATNGTLRPPSSQPSSKTPRQQAWEDEQKRFEVLGRELKHAVPLLKNDENGKKLAAIQSVESLLAFILGFVCWDEAAASADPKIRSSTTKWRSTQPYSKDVQAHCEPFNELSGLVCYVGIAVNQHIFNLLTELQKDSIPREQLLETQAIMQRAAIDADNLLDLDELRSAFPKTWAGRTKHAVTVARLRPEDSLAGQYRLPVGIQTSPLHAVRAGYAMLEEWLQAQKGLEYELKLRL